MEKSQSTISRPLVGVLAIGLFTASLVLMLWPGAIPGPMGATMGAATAKVSILMAALWLALPSGNRPAAWANLRLASAAPLVLVALALFRIPMRILIPLVGIIFLTGVVLRPRPVRRPDRRVE
jgi:hypothetical protein